jgi:hypothetical protein
VTRFIGVGVIGVRPVDFIAERWDGNMPIGMPMLVQQAIDEATRGEANKVARVPEAPKYDTEVQIRLEALAIAQTLTRHVAAVNIVYSYTRSGNVDRTKPSTLDFSGLDLMLKTAAGIEKYLTEGTTE